jgi:hypothetical protein
LLAELEKHPPTKVVSDMAAVPAPTSLAEDVIEALYAVRNAATHGELDPTDARDSRAAEAAYKLLLGLLHDVVANW